MWYEIITVVFAGISTIASIITAFAAFKAYSVYKKSHIYQSQKARDNASQIQIGEQNER